MVLPLAVHKYEIAHEAFVLKSETRQKLERIHILGDDIRVDTVHRILVMHDKHRTGYRFGGVSKVPEMFVELVSDVAAVIETLLDLMKSHGTYYKLGVVLFKNKETHGIAVDEHVVLRLKNRKLIADRIKMRVPVEFIRLEDFTVVVIELQYFFGIGLCWGENLQIEAVGFIKSIHGYPLFIKKKLLL